MLKRLLKPHVPERDDLSLQLLATNDPLSDTQRAQIQDKIVVLEAEFTRRSGRTYSLDLHEKLSARAQHCHSAIEAHRALLSLVRSIPLELLQHIFSFVVFREAPDTIHGRVHDRAALFTLCGVSARWRLAATTTCTLWTHLSPLRITYLRIKDLTPLTQLYLSRSGSLPMALTIGVWKTWTGDEESPIFDDANSKLVTYLVSMCDRWGSLDLLIPIGSVECLLSSIRGRLPLLSRLKIDFEHSGRLDGTVPLPKFDYFSNAPLLRRVDLYCKYSNSGPAAIDLPWSQLRVLRSRLNKQSTAAYKALIKSGPVNLRKLHYTMERKFWEGLSLPITPWLLPNLTDLRLYLAFNTASEVALFMGHIDTLSLPSLTSLTLVHDHYTSTGPLEELPNRVVSLIQRSRCDLKRLAMIDQRAPCAQDALLNVLQLCPNLTDLETQKPTAEFLSQLIPHSTPSPPILPHLTHLKIYCDWIDEDHDRVVSIPALMRVVLSRTAALGRVDSDPHHLRRLEDVYLDGVDLSLLQSDITEWECERILTEGCPSGSGPRHASCHGTLELAQEAAAQLHSYWVALQENKVYLHVYMQTDNAIRKLERLHPEQLNMLVFLRTEVMRKLVKIYWTEVGDVALRASLLQIRDRVSHLFHKWEPALLRNMKTCPYLWRESRDGDERYWRGRGIGDVRLMCWKAREGDMDDAALRNHLTK